MPPPGASQRLAGDQQHEDKQKQAFPWHPSTRGQTTQKTARQAFPGILFTEHQKTEFTDT